MAHGPGLLPVIGWVALSMLLCDCNRLGVQPPDARDATGHDATAHDAAARDAAAHEHTARDATDTPTGGWNERILNPDGSINFTEYANVANNYNRRDIIDYRFGPKYAYYHSTPEAFPTMYGNSDANGWHNGGWNRQPNAEEYLEWYSEGGHLLISPDANAPTEWQPGVAQCWNGGIWGFKVEPKYSLLNRLTYDDVMSQYGSKQVPDPGPVSQLWKDASGGTVQAPPVTVARTHGSSGVTGFMIFNNGLIGVSGTGNDPYHWGISERIAIKLPSGKVPTAAAVTSTQEFLLVTVWDAAQRKGQVAVIAVKGSIVGADSDMETGGIPHELRPRFWGFPNWPAVTEMKLLGFVDLPFAAPTAINVSQDHAAGNGRGYKVNEVVNLDSQSERDIWYNWTGSDWKRTARSGYAVVASRAENKVAFIDLQPLFQYYRTMNFTSQANYNLTKNQGAADNQWPYTFTYVPSQKPTVYSTINVTRPTAVAAGLLNRGMWPPFRNGDAVTENAYVATMDGSLLMYKVGDLMTTASGGSIGSPFKTVPIGNNPSSIAYGWSQSNYGDDLIITSRGDNAIYYLNSDGSTRGVLRDSRIQDAVSTAFSGAGRWFRDAGWASAFLHVMDFTGKKILNYRYHTGYEDSDMIPVGNPPNPPNRSTIFEFSSEQKPPGQPFFFVSAEVI